MKGVSERTGAALKVIQYHEETKHRPGRYARAPGYLDWESAPDPFRRYDGTVPVRLPFLKEDPEANYFSLYERARNIPRSFSLQNVAAFLELSLGLSTWKRFLGGKWALRINPSSGNLHPTEAYLILPFFAEGAHPGGVFHYNPFFHALEPRAAFDDMLRERLRGHFGTEGFLVGLSSIYWKEAWKYGERAFRYCNHDLGHAVACMSFSANLLGWKAVYLNALSYQDIETVLGFRKTVWQPFEKEHPELLLFIHSNTSGPAPCDVPSEIIRSFSSLVFEGRPNRLSSDHVDWELISETAQATLKPKTDEARYRYNVQEYAEKEIPGKQAAQIIRRRRSAQHYDGKTPIAKDAFLALLDKTVPRNGSAPFDAGLEEVCIHLLLFVHRVGGIGPGIYFLLRDEDDFENIRRECRDDFLWERVKGGPGALPLYLLQQGDFRETAERVSCGQDIAGDSAFAVAMIAKFRDIVESRPYRYRTLHWAAGMIGQVLYLEAEAHSLRGAGIGCFFDDLVHQLLGFADNAYQDLYHFTVGGPSDDARLTALPAYYHLEK